MSNERSIGWKTCAFSELDARTWHDIVKLRIDVFVVEQNCPYPELDGLDLDALHVIGFDTQQRPVAYCRILPPQQDGLPHIGRVVVDNAHRRSGLGKQLMLEALRSVKHQFGSPRSALAAQAYLQRFYEGFGYRVSSDVYPWDGIPHIDMVRGESDLT